MPTNWITFAAGISSPPAFAAPDAAAGHTLYEVAFCRPVIGPAPPIASGSPLLRLESSRPPILPGCDPAFEFRGTAQHQQYTAGSQRAELDSIGPFPNSSDLHCVLIPIHKTADWWQLPADVRGGFFHRGGEHHQHAAIGAPYAKRIHRRLFHSRYGGGAEAPIPYDFLTYFEFQESELSAFQDLLAGLRDTSRNPEWAYVDGEFEIWMRRL